VLLARAANLRQHDMAGVTLKFLWRKWPIVSHENDPFAVKAV
jgi:hypothetical protein